MAKTNKKNNQKAAVFQKNKKVQQTQKVNNKFGKQSQGFKNKQNKFQKKNLKRTIDQLEVSPKKFAKVGENKSVPIKEESKENTEEHLSHRMTIYYYGKPDAQNHYDQLKNNLEKNGIRDLVLNSSVIDTAILKLYVGPKPLSDKEKAELLKLTKASNIYPASKFKKSLDKLLLLKYEDSKVAKELFLKREIKFRGRKVVLSYADKNFRTAHLHKESNVTKKQKNKASGKKTDLLKKADTTLEMDNSEGVDNSDYDMEEDSADNIEETSSSNVTEESSEESSDDVNEESSENVEEETDDESDASYEEEESD